MNNENETKKYFIKDEELSVIEEDKLNYKDIVKNLKLIVDNTKPPFNILITGESGVGKSSIINFLINKYKNNSEEYNIEKINVWKDDLSIKQYLDSKYSKIEDNFEEKKEIKNEENNNNDNSSANNAVKEKKLSKPVKAVLAICNAILIYVLCFFITSIIFIVMEFFQNKDIYRTNDIFFVENTYLNYSENLGFIMLFSAILAGIVIIIKKLASKEDKVIKEEIINTIDIKETEQENNLQKQNEIDTKTNLIVIEDIDKLSIAKMLKCLEEIKCCRNYSNCIFIVPLDKNILRKAIEIRNKIKLSSKHKPLKLEKVLDKIFEFKIHVPQTANIYFKEYAYDLVKDEIEDFIDEYCNSDTFESVLKNVIIHKNVKTPRHVKKLINNFINNKLLAFSKYEDGFIDEDFIESKDFDFQLAKISVLQSDFEEFYDILFNDFNYLNIFTEICCSSKETIQEQYDNLEEDLKVFLKSKYKPLRSFLKQTRKYEIKDIVTLMYLTKNTQENLFNSKPISLYIMGEQPLEELNNEDLNSLIKMIDDSKMLKEFTVNNFDKMLENYINNATNKEYFIDFNNNIKEIEEYIDKDDYIKYLKIVAINYNFYPEEALYVFKNSKTEITGDVMSILIEKLKENLTSDNYQDTFETVRDNSDCFYEENGNLSEYVQFLVDYIKLSPNPDEVINELDENFTRIGKVYELNKNIKGLENLDYDKAYMFMAKCLDNGDLQRMAIVMNSILSDDGDGITDCLKIEERMRKYNLMDAIEYNVDEIIEAESSKLGLDEKPEIEGEINNIDTNYQLLKNLLELCTIKQIYISEIDVMKIVEKCLNNIADEEYILAIYEILKKFDRMYFYEIRRDFNEIIYTSFHTATNNLIKETALETTRYFKNTRLFKTKLTKQEEAFYNAHSNN